MANTQFHLRPVYLVLGVAADRRPVIEQLLADLRDELATQPTLGDQIRLGVIEFSGRADVRLPLSDPLDPTQPMLPPPIPGDGLNSLAAAFTAIRSAIAADTIALTASGRLVDRPVVWLIVDRETTDSPELWPAVFRELTEAPGSPYILPCGMGSVPDELLRTLTHPSGTYATTVAYAARDADALVVVLASAIILTASREASRPLLVLPEPDLLPAGIRTIAMNEPPRPATHSASE